VKRHGLLCALACGLLLTASGCGVRTPPRPPEDTAIEVASPKASRRDDGTVKLSWARPKHSADGHKLVDLAGFVVERRTLGTPFVEIAVVPVTDNERVRPQQTFTFADTPPPAKSVFYRVHAFDLAGQHGPPSPAVEVPGPGAS